jgi:hypothetical protein
VRPIGAAGIGIVIFGALTVPTVVAGCADLRGRNTEAFLEPPVRTSRDHAAGLVFKTAVLYPARDLLTFDWLGRILFGDRAWNADGDGVADSSFFTNRRPPELTPERLLHGPGEDDRPQPPFRVETVKTSGSSPGFIGRDDRGRRYLFKLDDPDYPELGSAAAVIGARILWALGYNVSANCVVVIEGTGDARFDGRRSVASRYLDHAVGRWKLDWFRYRREVRGLRMACAWINDVDRVGTNTLVTVEHGRAWYYLIDFNSCLGAWQGRPKPAWRGWRHASDIFWPALRGLSLGTWPPGFDPNQPVISSAVGRFNAAYQPLTWRSQFPNTAFEHLTEADLCWIASKIRTLEREHIEAIVAAAQYRDPRDAGYVVETLLARRQCILELAESLVPAPAAR